MSDTMSPRAELLSLPHELLDLIFDKLEQPQLKSTRQSSKFLNKLSTPRLFARFVVYPHIRSFERLISISQSDHLRHHVQLLTYETSFLGVTPWLVKHLEAVWSEQISAEEKKKALHHAQHLDSQKIRADVVLDNLVQADYMERAFARLTNVRQLVFHETGRSGQTFHRDDMPHFYKQMEEETCGQFPHARLPRGPLSMHHRTIGTYAHAVLVAASRLARPLEHLTLDVSGWNYFLQEGDFSKYPSLFQKHLTNLTSLTIAAQTYDYIPGGRAMLNLQTLLGAAVNLEDFTLCVREPDEICLYGPDMTDDDSGMPVLSMFQYCPQEKLVTPIPKQLIWSPKLRYLDLYGIHCTAKEFKAILRPCTATLEFISLSTIILLPEKWDHKPRCETPRACWVNTFKWMQRHLTNLKRLNIHGTLTNGGLQHWIVDPSSNNEDCLRMKVYKFLLEGGPCPLEHVAIKSGEYDLKKKIYKYGLPDEISQNTVFEGDESWVMEYESAEIESVESEIDDDDDHWGIYEDGDDYDEDEDEDDMDDEELYQFGMDGGPVPPSLLGTF